MNFYKNVNRLYLIIFFHNLIPAYVIERLFWQERGMSVQMVVYCEMIYAITIVLLEIPSGVLADRLGRKKLLVIGSLLACSEFAILIFARQFWHFGLVTCIAGVSRACTSGSWNALLYDSLRAGGQEDSFEKILGRMQAVDFTASMAAAILGSVLAGYFGFITNYQLSIGSMVIAFAASLLLREPPRYDGLSEKESTAKEITMQAITFFKKNMNVLAVIIHAMLIAACVNYVDEFWQVYLGELSFPVVLFGVVSAGLTMVRIPGALVAAYLLARLKPKAILILVSLFSAVGIIEAALIKNAAGMLGMALVCFCAGVMEPVVSGYVHHRADSSARATIDSISSLVERVFTITAGLIFGYAASHFTIFSGYWVLGIMCSVGTCVYAIIYRRVE